MIGLSEIRAQAWKYGCLVVAVLAVAAVIAALLFRGDAAVSGARADAAEQRASQAKAQLEDTRKALSEEREHALALWRVGAQYEQDKIDAKAKSDAVVAGLRSDNLRLRQQWTCAARTPEAGTTAGEPDGGAGLREQGAADLVRAAAEADAQIRGLQKVIEADRAQH